MPNTQNTVTEISPFSSDLHLALFLMLMVKILKTNEVSQDAISKLENLLETCYKTGFENGRKSSLELS